MAKTERAGYSREELINGLSIAAQLKQMFNVLKLVSGKLILENQTLESHRFIRSVWTGAKDCENFCSKLIKWHREQLDELINLEELWDRAPPNDNGGESKSK